MRFSLHEYSFTWDGTEITGKVCGVFFQISNLNKIQKHSDWEKNIWIIKKVTLITLWNVYIMVMGHPQSVSGSYPQRSVNNGSTTVTDTSFNLVVMATKSKRKGSSLSLPSATGKVFWTFWMEKWLIQEAQQWRNPIFPWRRGDCLVSRSQRWGHCRRNHEFLVFHFRELAISRSQLMENTNSQYFSYVK